MASMAESGTGYLHFDTIITPYMQILVFHVPTLIRLQGSLKNFSGRGILQLHVHVEALCLNKEHWILKSE